MLTGMTEADWDVVLTVFREVCSRRGDKGRDDRKFLEALHYFSVNTVAWRAFATLLDLGLDIQPRAVVADKGYDANANRALARQRGICPAIPFKSNAKNKPSFFPKLLYRGRSRIEQTFGKLKRFKRVAFRCEKTAQSYAAFVSLALGFIIIKSVHTA